jgi:DNA processing protein
MIRMDVHTAVALSLVRGVSPSRVAASLRELAGRFPEVSSTILAEQVRETFGLDADALNQARIEADQAIARAEHAQLEAVPFGEPRYPPLLATIHDPPPVLWIRGRSATLAAPSVALVGARAASSSALAVAADLAGALAAAGIVVVSGLARGVDSAAHRGSLEAGGTTVAVLGCGADRVYPAEHADLARGIATAGAIVSELPPGAPPLAEHFPRRNRVISGLALATVVVEASERSGSLITARLALEQGREVMAVPGSTLSGRNRGGHALLRDGAKLVETADDILEELPGFARRKATPDVAGNLLEKDGLLASFEGGEPLGVDGLAERTGLDTGTLLARLLDLELAGRVERVGGGRFRRV